MYLVVGTTTVDLFISGLKRIPQVKGDEFTTSSLAICDNPLMMALGGNGANSAYVLASLGAPVSLLSGCGRDELGDDVLAWLGGRGVDLANYVRHPALATATTTIVSDNNLNRLAFYHPGANHGFGPDDIAGDTIEKTTALLITGYTLMPRFRAEGYRQVLAAAKRSGALTTLDIGPAIADPVRLPELEPLLPHIDYLLCNEYELGVCAGEGGEGGSEENVGRALAAGARCLVLKRGAAGATAWTERERIDAPGFSVKVQTTVGAGDSFNAGFLFARGRGSSLERALTAGNATAALVVSGGRGVLDAPAFSQVEALMVKR